MALERREAIKENLTSGSMLEEAYYSLSKLYGDILSQSLGLSSHEELAEATTIRKITISGAGSASHVDVMALLSLFPNQDLHIEITDISQDAMLAAQSEWNFFVANLRRDMRTSLSSSTVTFRVADAYDPRQFSPENDLTIMRNVGSGELTDNPEKYKTKFVSTATAITRRGGLIVMTAIEPTEIEQHDSIMSRQPVTILYNEQRPEIVVYTPSDAHAIVARRN